MQKPTEHFLQATALRADVLAAPSIWLPRREVLLDWLNGFLKRAEQPAYDLGETEAEDLKELDLFLRRKKIPVAAA